MNIFFVFRKKVVGDFDKIRFFFILLYRNVALEIFLLLLSTISNEILYSADINKKRCGSRHLFFCCILFLAQYWNTFNVMSVREHVNGLNLLKLKVFFDQELYISSHCDWIAWDVEEFEIILFFEIRKVFDNIWMKSFARWIDDNESNILNFFF